MFPPSPLCISIVVLFVLVSTFTLVFILILALVTVGRMMMMMIIIIMIIIIILLLLLLLLLIIIIMIMTITIILKITCDITEWLQYGVFITSLGRGMGMNIAAQLHRVKLACIAFYEYRVMLRNASPTVCYTIKC